jgi:hypothetical protein
LNPSLISSENHYESSEEEEEEEEEEGQAIDRCEFSSTSTNNKTAFLQV